MAVRAKALKNLDLRDSPLTDVSADSVMILGGGSVVSEYSCQHLADSVMILGNSMVDLGGGWGVSERPCRHAAAFVMTWGSSMVKLGWWWVYHKEKIGVLEEILSLDIQDEKMK